MTRRAYIAAIDNYPDPYKTLNDLNDLADLQNTLIPKGFSISSHTDAFATRANILASLTNLVTQAVSGDSIFFAFFGHGSWFNGPYGRAECICPVDVFQGGLIADYELQAILAMLPAGVTCEVLLGNCYAGTGTSQAAMPEKKEGKAGKKEIQVIQPLCIPGPMPYNPDEAEQIFGPAPKVAVPVESMNHILNAACRRDQLSYGVLTGGKHRGLYPLYWCYAIRNFPTKTRAQIDAWVTPYVKAVVPTQEPQLEGPSAELAQLPFT
jgi:hypothetical protein